MRHLLLAALLLSSSGCALTNLTITPPQEPGSAGVTGGKQRSVVLALPFADDRPDKERCGMKKNGYNMETAKVFCSAPPTEWVAGLLANELQAAGFKVVTTGQGPAGAVRIDGHLLQYFIEPKLNFFTVALEADVHVRLVVSAPSGLVAERDFYVKGEDASVIGGFEYLFQAASDAGVRRIVGEMAAAVVTLMDRYPDATVQVSAIPAS